MNRRVVLLLDPPELTPRQLAQRKYQQSHKGKAAARRAHRKRAQDPAYRAASSERAKRWAEKNITLRRVYKRTWTRARKLRMLGSSACGSVSER